MAAADWVIFHWTDCSIVISVFLSGSVCLSLQFCLPCCSAMLFHMHPFHFLCLLTDHPARTITDEHKQKTMQLFPLIFTVAPSPPQGLKLQLVVRSPNSSCSAWLCLCGVWQWVCSLWLKSPPLVKVSSCETLLWSTKTREIFCYISTFMVQFWENVLLMCSEMSRSHFPSAMSPENISLVRWGEVE